MDDKLNTKKTQNILQEIEVNTGETAKAVASQDEAAEERRQLSHVTTPEGKIVATPTSTEEQDRSTAGQRAINHMWESTQRNIALLVIASAIGVAAGLSIGGTTEVQVAAFGFLFGAANLVIGFYFGRTNHTRTGGTGNTKEQER